MISILESVLSVNNKFLIHEHYAKKAGLHYDLRLGYDNTLKSFACRKISDLISGKVKKILLIQQPDHDPSWFDFEGEIEDGYGAGKVVIWDKGTFKIVQWKDKSITLIFSGSKLIGEYTLIKYLKPNQWLMFKSNISSKEKS